MGLDISLLETFLLVARLGSFSKAARRLGLSQPAVSLQVKVLEKEVGASLIDRAPGRVQLTPAGHVACRHARGVLKERDRLMAGIPRATGDVSGNLLMAASTIPGEFLLPSIAARFYRACPGVKVFIDTTDTRGVAAQLREMRIELGFTGAPLEDAEIHEEHFAHDRLVVITPADHPLGSGGPVLPADLVGVPFVGRTRGSGTVRVLVDALAGQGISPGDLDVVAEFGSTQAAVSAVQSGMGISVVSQKAAWLPAQNGLLRMVEVTGVDLSRPFFAVRHRDRVLSLAAETFLEFCLAPPPGFQTEPPDAGDP